MVSEKPVEGGEKGFDEESEGEKAGRTRGIGNEPNAPFG